MSPEDQHAAAESVRALLAAIDAGEVTATPAERAYLAGALNVLDWLSAPQGGGDGT